jgi:hypothetical protein
VVLPISLVLINCAIALPAALRSLSALRLTAQSAEHASSLLQFSTLSPRLLFSVFGSWELSWRLANLTAEPDKPCQADGAMPAVIVPDFGVAVLIPRRSPNVRQEQPIADHDERRLVLEETWKSLMTL